MCIRDSLEDNFHFSDGLRVEKRNLAVEPSGPLEIDIDLVRTVRHQHKQHAPSVRGIAHELFDARNHPARGATVILALVAKSAVGLVDDHHDLTDRLDHLEDALEIAFCGTDPLAAEVQMCIRDRLGSTIERTRRT